MKAGDRVRVRDTRPTEEEDPCWVPTDFFEVRVAGKVGEVVRVDNDDTVYVEVAEGERYWFFKSSLKPF